MAKRTAILIGCLLLNIVSHTSANESNVGQVVPEEDINPKLDNKPYGTAQNIQAANESPSGQREKRFYNYFDYNFDYNLNPEYSAFNKRRDDPLELILRKLEEITNTFNQRKYLPPPAIPPPTFIPFFYVPKVVCPCLNSQPTPSKQPNQTSQSVPNKNTTDNNSQTPNKEVPDFTDRFMGVDDSREIWGGSDTNADYENADETDGIRPISLNPVKPNRPSSIPSPPVEHGSEQAGLQPGKEQPASDMTPPPTVAIETDSRLPPQSNVGNAGITLCESAAVSCCHKPQVTYECFRSNGCSNPIELGSPCDPQVILKIVNKLQYYYGTKNTADGS